MCFTIHDSNRNILTAKKDITCYKVIRLYGNQLRGVYQQSYHYKVDKTLSVRGWEDETSKIIRAQLGSIHKGFHSHSAQRPVKRMWMCGCKVYKCTIPKGALYLYNPIKQQYVSNKLILVEEMDKNKIR